MGPQHAGVERAQEHHVAQAGELRLGREVRRPLTHRVAVVVDHAHQLLAHERDSFDPLVQRRLGHLAGRTDEPHPVGGLLPTRRLGDPFAAPVVAKLGATGFKLGMRKLGKIVER
jgi:hypothetical protein